jgi:hypothetical protein
MWPVCRPARFGSPLSPLRRPRQPRGRPLNCTRAVGGAALENRATRAIDRYVGRCPAAPTGDAIAMPPRGREGVYGEPRQLRRWGRRADGVHRYCHREGDRAGGRPRCGAQGTPMGVARCGTNGDIARNSRRVALTVPVGVFHSWRHLGRSRSSGPEGLCGPTHGLVPAGCCSHRDEWRPHGRRHRAFVALNRRPGALALALSPRDRLARRG